MKEIVVLSGKGGTGKSSLTAAFAALEAKVVVADCDVDAANLHLVLKPNNYREEVYISGQEAKINYEKCTNCGLCMKYCRFDAIHRINERIEISETACDGCQLCSRVCPSNAIEMIENNQSRWYEGHIRNGKLIHARLAPGEDNSGKLVSIVRDKAREAAFDINSELILIDGPPGIGCPVISALTGTDTVLLVTEPSQSGLHDLQRIIELINQFKIEAFVVINKYDLNEDLTKQIESWCLSSHIPILGKIPFDKLVIESMVNCQTITDFAPEATLTSEIKQIWNKLTQNEYTESIQ